MSKRILAIVMCLMMALGCAMAEKSDAMWSLAVDEIVVGDGTTKVALNPSVEVLFGREGAGFWAQISLLLDGVSAGAVQGQLDGSTIQVSADGAKDYLTIDGTDTFLQQYGIEAKELLDELDDLMEELEERDFIEPDDLDDLNEIPGMTVELLSENSLRVTVEQDAVNVSFRLGWNRLDGGKPFDLSVKNPCRYTYREMYPGDGTDIPDALSAALTALMMDGTVQEAVALFGEPVLDM